MKYSEALELSSMSLLDVNRHENEMKTELTSAWFQFQTARVLTIYNFQHVNSVIVEKLNCLYRKYYFGSWVNHENKKLFQYWHKWTIFDPFANNYKLLNRT